MHICTCAEHTSAKYIYVWKMKIFIYIYIYIYMHICGEYLFIFANLLTAMCYVHTALRYVCRLPGIKADICTAAAGTLIEQHDDSNSNLKWAMGNRHLRKQLLSKVHVKCYCNSCCKCCCYCYCRCYCYWFLLLLLCLFSHSLLPVACCLLA